MKVEDFNKWRGECPLYTERLTRKYTTVDLAGFLNVSRQALNDWEAGRIPTAEHFAKLSEVFGKDIQKRYQDWLAKKPMVKA